MGAETPDPTWDLLWAPSQACSRAILWGLQFKINGQEYLSRKNIERGKILSSGSSGFLRSANHTITAH